MSSIYAVVNKGVVINTVVWDGLTEWKADGGTAVLADASIGIGWLYDGKAFHEPPPRIVTHKELVEAAEQRQQVLLTLVDEVTSDWRVELMLGDISENDKAKLAAWMNYKKVVKAVDVSVAPDINWPAQPDI
ncbi:TPA: tail fiber assembly protein [Serratia marcescens]|nr:tail fiber assembly protein [Klebsiella pneumoniae]